MQAGVWFDRLVRDGLFSRRLISRYRELRRGYLSDEYLEGLIDEIVAHLGDAAARDWNRWQYDNPDALLRDKLGIGPHPSLTANTRNFEQEIAHIKSVLRQHAAWLDRHLGDVVMSNPIID
jgi:hypothetical protein